ncbi:hypothetical protein [Streptomyces umbrinus]|uniref:hypothetical protein n=1 Tax=Streptomyces umbrinus TaxID=67370 RepID=UPI003C30A62B
MDHYDLVEVTRLLGPGCDPVEHGQRILAGTGLHEDGVRGAHQLEWLVGEFVQEADGDFVAADCSGAGRCMPGVRGAQGPVGCAGGQEGACRLVLGGPEAAVAVDVRILALLQYSGGRAGLRSSLGGGRLLFEVVDMGLCLGGVRFSGGGARCGRVCGSRLLGVTDQLQQVQACGDVHGFLSRVGCLRFGPRGGRLPLPPAWVWGG